MKRESSIRRRDNQNYYNKLAGNRGVGGWNSMVFLRQEASMQKRLPLEFELACH